LRRFRPEFDHVPAPAWLCFRLGDGLDGKSGHTRRGPVIREKAIDGPGAAYFRDGKFARQLGGEGGGELPAAGGPARPAGTTGPSISANAASIVAAQCLQSNITGHEHSPVQRSPS